MPKDNHSDCIKELEEAQQTDHDLRQMVREADHFLHKRDGQWEPEVIARWTGRPRYTFDQCSMIVDDIMGEMEQMDFDIRVVPSGDDASKDIAQAYEGIIRNIENLSGARFIYNSAARIMVGTGFSAWRIYTDYRDADSFQQDILIEQVCNAQDSLWFDPNAKRQDMSDADFAWILHSMTRKEYEKMYPKGSGMSVGSDRRQQVYSYKKTNEVVIGEYFYKKRKDVDLVYMSNGGVYRVDDEFKSVQDDLERLGVTIVKSRKRPYDVVYRKFFDGGDWLGDAKETPFCYVPVVPCYGNFKISENKIIYSGVVEKLMDAQRLINYANSRKIEEAAFSPRQKYWATKDQALSPDVRRSMRTLNINADPIQFYDYAEGQPPPFMQGAPPPNPSLMEISDSNTNFIQRISGTFDEARGTAPAQRSGTAIDKLQQKSDNPKRKWFTAVEIALSHTCRILIKAIPKVYDTAQELSLINQDGTEDSIKILTPVMDEQTGQTVLLNDLSIGNYSVTCSAGPAFHSRQQETVTAINELAAIDPSILAMGADVLLNNIASPGVDIIADRKRAQMIQQGIIPEDQLTDEEKQKMAQQKQQANQPSPIDQANLMIAQATAKDIEGKNQERAVKLQLEQQKLQLKQLEISIKSQQQDQKSTMELMKALVDQAKTQAETLKLIRESMGVDAIVGRETIETYKDQSELLGTTISNQERYATMSTGT